MGMSAVARGASASPAAVTVAAASDLRGALDRVAEAFRRAAGPTLRITFGSSGNLSRQIALGAPFELFLAADESYDDRLVGEGHAIGPGSIYAVGRLALVARRGADFDPTGGLAALTAAVAAGRVQRLAIANPEHAPYGGRAREALERAGVRAAAKDRLILAENVAQAGQYVLTGAADAGLIGSSALALPEVAAAFAHALVPAELYTALRQRMVLTRRAGEGARDLYAFILAPEAQAILARHGFDRP
jgi:molybdate transport system substrate-binding protein